MLEDDGTVSVHFFDKKGLFTFGTRQLVLEKGVSFPPCVKEVAIGSRVRESGWVFNDVGSMRADKYGGDMVMAEPFMLPQYIANATYLMVRGCKKKEVEGDKAVWQALERSLNELLQHTYPAWTVTFSSFSPFYSKQTYFESSHFFSRFSSPSPTSSSSSSPASLPSPSSSSSSPTSTPDPVLLSELYLSTPLSSRPTLTRTPAIVQDWRCVSERERTDEEKGERFEGYRLWQPSKLGKVAEQEVTEFYLHFDVADIHQGKQYMSISVGAHQRCANPDHALIKHDRFPTLAAFGFTPTDSEHCYARKRFQNLVDTPAFVMGEIAARSIPDKVPAHFELRGYSISSTLSCNQDGSGGGEEGVSACMGATAVGVRVSNTAVGEGMHREVSTSIALQPSSSEGTTTAKTATTTAEITHVNVVDAYPKELYVDEFEVERRKMSPNVVTDVSVETMSSSSGPCLTTTELGTTDEVTWSYSSVYHARYVPALKEGEPTTLSFSPHRGVVLWRSSPSSKLKIRPRLYIAEMHTEGDLAVSIPVSSEANLPMAFVIPIVSAGMGIALIFKAAHNFRHSRPKKSL